MRRAGTLRAIVTCNDSLASCELVRLLHLAIVAPSLTPGVSSRHADAISHHIAGPAELG
jgi:hypothetical protein